MPRHARLGFRCRPRVTVEPRARHLPVHLSNSLQPSSDRVQSKQNRPLFFAWARGFARLASLPFPLMSRGMARRQGAVPGLLQAMSGSGRTMVRSVAPAPLGAPTQHLRNVGACQGHFCSLTVSERRLRGRACVRAVPQVPLPFPARKTPHESAPRRQNGMI